MIISLEEAKEYLQIDYTDGDSLINSMIIAAEEYFRNATGKTYLENEAPELVKLGFKMLLSHWYDNRGTVVIGTISSELEFTLKNILFQTKWT